MIGQIYKLKKKFHSFWNDEYIVVEELNHVLALMNNRTNEVHWVTRHVLGLDYDFKVGEE